MLLPLTHGPPSKRLIKGEDMKWVALVLLVVQNTALVLLMRFSLTGSSDHYIVTTAVASMEVRSRVHKAGGDGLPSVMKGRVFLAA
jgi:hypothetical protein